MNKIITAAFENPLKARGFVKKSGSWYLNQDETILVANLQKSQYGDQYYINLGTWMKRLGPQEFPKEALCHIRIRLSSLMGGAIEKALNGEDASISDADRQLIVERAVQDQAIPFLLDCSRTEDVKRMLTDGKLAKAFVHKGVKALLREQ